MCFFQAFWKVFEQKTGVFSGVLRLKCCFGVYFGSKNGCFGVFWGI